MSLTVGESTCPICGRRWTVTPWDDCMMPGCGCFGSDYTAANPARPCTPCGLAHMGAGHLQVVVYDPRNSN